MIAYFALGVLLLAILLIVLEWWARASTADAKRTLMLVGLGLALMLGLLLMLRGQWLLSLIPVGLAAGRFFNISRQIMGFTRFFRGRSDQKPGAEPPPNVPGLTRREALEILDLPADAGQADIQESYKRLMAQVHPDKGGSPWMAERLNAARDRLLKDD